MLASSQTPQLIQQPSTPSAKLEPFLLNSSAGLPDLKVLKEHKVAAYAYSVLPETHASRAALQADFVFATMNHMKVKSSVQPLFKAWSDAGIKLLVFKGFYLAEFVYSVAAQRAYGDVDVLIDPKDASRASLIAQNLGWVEAWQADDSNASADLKRHEVLNLEHAHYPIRLDVHGLISHVTGQSTQLQERLTKQIWAAATPVTWEDTKLYTPSLSDSALLGLVTTRSWSSDAWRLKVQDYLDLNLLKEQGLSLHALKARAKELNCTQTLKLFLKRCDPYRKHLSLQQPSAKQKTNWEKQILLERGSPSLERFGRNSVQALADVTWALPSFLLAVLFAFQPSRLQVVLNPLKCEDQDLRKVRLQRLERGIRAYLQVTGLAKLKTERLKTLALFVSLRRVGYPVVLRFVRNEYILKFRETPVASLLNE